MEFTFSPVRVGILLALLAAFACWGGYFVPDGAPHQLAKAWFYSALFFSLGAVSATITDHWIGNLDRSNLRWLYVFLGVICMGGGLVYQHVLKERMKIIAESGY
ncbi:hypothetical protein [Luteolibacter marinus]|uniref:hypothetical protein n=1 Tax=Luteolibacter marinus TaxID=2776705 RepID=UPI001867CFBD|nr:hypothetical protein [Luteolibacter marinus]